MLSLNIVMYKENVLFRFDGCVLNEFLCATSRLILISMGNVTSGPSYQHSKGKTKHVVMRLIYVTTKQCLVGLK